MAQRFRRAAAALTVALAGGAAIAHGSELALAGDTPTAAIVIDSIDGTAAAASAPATRITVVPPATDKILFPMDPSPRCEILDNFGDPRSGGRSHQGTDILATKGQAVYAVAAGVLSDQAVVGNADARLSGNSWSLRATDGTRFMYAHLSAFADGLQVGNSVVAGQLIGYVGDTGDPGPGNYHLHFELHPNGGAAVNALPFLAIPASCRVY